MDDNGHGTHTAGTIAAAKNGIGIVGVAPNVKIAGIKAGNADGFFYPEAVVCAFMWAGGHKLAGTNNSYFADPFKKMTFASRMQHKIYWGPLKKPIEWSLKTVLAPWSYIASVVYHDTFWYPVVAKARMAQVLNSEWGRLFRNWERLVPDEQGFPSIGEDAAELTRVGLRALGESMRVLGTTIKEAPEFTHRKRARHVIK